MIVLSVILHLDLKSSLHVICAMYTSCCVKYAAFNLPIHHYVQEKLQTSYFVVKQSRGVIFIARDLLKTNQNDFCIQPKHLYTTNSLHSLEPNTHEKTRMREKLGCVKRVNMSA